MRIGELARTTGVSADTIRYYERIGLLPRAARTSGGYRSYAEGAARRIRVIRNAVQLGFPLREITKVLRVRDSGGMPCRQVRDYAAGLVDAIENRIAQLEFERQSMLAMIADWDRKLAASGNARAHLLEGQVAPRAARPKHLRIRDARR